MPTTEFDDRVAVVTGGASGIGLATGRLLAGRGAKVVLADRDGRAAEDAAGSIGAAALGVATDVTVPDDVTSLVTRASEHFGPPDVLVNSAGIVSKHRLVDLPVAAWDDMMAVHAKGTYLCTQAAAQAMEGRGGAIVNVSSIAAELGNPLAVHYAAAKGAIRMITRAAAVALAPSGIRVNAVGPGSTVTPLTAGRLSDAAMRDAALQRVPMGRFAEPDDVAEVICFLASDRSRYVTGQTIYVDGGWTAQLYAADYARMQEERLVAQLGGEEGRS